MRKGMRLIMKKVLFVCLLVLSQSFALTLEQVRSDLKKSMVSADSVEVKMEMTVNSIAGQLKTTVYVAQKGIEKCYTEIRNDQIQQRSVVNGDRIKIIDLKNKTSKVLPYNGEVLEAQTYTNFNPLASGNWSEPVFFSDGVYLIKDNSSTVYYDSKKKRIEKMETTEHDRSVFTRFDYDGNNNLKTMTMSVYVGDVVTTITIDIVLLRNSSKLPDLIFEI